MEGHCTGGRPLSFGARPWCDVRAVTSNAQPAFAWHARKRHCAGCLSGGGKHASLPRARAVPRWLRSSTHYGRALHRREASLLRCKTVVRRASCDLQHAAGFRVAARERHCAGCLSGGGRTRKLAAHARRAALAVIGLRTTKSTAPAEDLSLSVQDRGATCELWPPTRSRHSRGTSQAPLRWLSLGRWRNTRACRARAPCRAGCDRPTHMKGTAPAGGLSLSVQDRGATCEL